MGWVIVMAAFVVLSMAALGLLDKPTTQIADAFRQAWESLK